MQRGDILRRSRDLKRRIENLGELRASLTREAETDSAVADDVHRPDREVRRREIEGMLERALEALSPEHKEVLVLREIQGMDYDAIAAIVRCRKGTVKSRLARAREQLRVRLIELGGEWL